MSDKKNVFQRAYDAMVESRMRHAQREIAVYRDMFEMNTRNKGL